ncbi:putative peptide maturation dehydrogenase [Actinoplanes sp. NPDC023714]|uniref:putative peptide maturation dehydrogenase n=1 Tax=Actinoplanes sp. NPDC023714 TaxID=3154322 RepID=UPI0033C3FD71
MPRFRRTGYVFLRCEDRSLIDVAALLRGRAELATHPQITAVSALTAVERAISRTQLDLILSLPARSWTRRDADDAEALRRLATDGLVLSDEPDDHLSELRRRDETLTAGQWDVHAALYHFLTQWRDVDAGGSPAEADPTGALIGAHGPPPPHFAPAARPLAVTELALEERRGGLWDTLARRRTTRVFTPEPLTAGELSLVLRYTAGCRGYSRIAEDAVILSKTSPSGGAMHPTELYVLARRVDGVEPGLHHYDAGRHTLELLSRHTPDAIGSLALELSAGQAFTRDAAALFLVTTRFSRNFWKYRQHRRAYAVLLMDAAHLGQTFSLVCAELGLGAFVTAAVNGANIEERLGLDPYSEGALALWGCGRPGPGPDGPVFEPYIPRTTTI